MANPALPNFRKWPALVLRGPMKWHRKFKVTPTKRWHRIASSVLLLLAVVACWKNWSILENGLRNASLRCFGAISIQSCGAYLCKYQRFKSCINYHKPSMPTSSQKFLRIGGDSPRGAARILAYSAYIDYRSGTVKVVTDTDTLCYGSLQIICLLWYAENDSPHIANLTLDYITNAQPEQAWRIATVYYCKLPQGVSRAPEFVSFDDLGDGCSRDTSNTALAVHRPAMRRHQFAVCVPPIFGTLSESTLVQFVEMHRLLGAEKFYFYNESIPEECSRLLSAYVRKEVAEVIPWQSVYLDDIMYHNQEAMQIDCMYRNVDQAKYVAQLDVDEVLMPRTFRTWIELIKAFEKPDTALFMFLNRFYATDSKEHCLSDNLDSAPVNNGTYFRRLQYYTTSFGATDRSKIIYRPERLERIYTHHALPHREYQTVVLNTTTAVLHHYRNPVPRRFRSAATTIDYRMCELEMELAAKVRQMLRAPS